MKKLLLSIALLGGILSVCLVILASITTTNPILLKFEQMHNKGVIKTPQVLGVVIGDSVYLKELELKGTWRLPESGSALRPYQAFQWYSDPNSDSPLKLLSWTGIVFDTTWVKTVINADSVTFSIPNKSLKAFRTAATGWTITGGAAAVKGWMDTTATYLVDVYGVSAKGEVLLKTLTFQGFTGGTKNFTDCEYEMKYIAAGHGHNSAALTPQTITSGETYMRMKFKNGLTGFKFPIVAGTNSLKIVWRTPALTFNTQTIGITQTTTSGTGLKGQVEITNTPVSGYFNAGDTVKINVFAKSDSGAVLDWQTQASQLGITRVGIIVSGPKRDYMRIMPLQYLVNNYTLQTYPAAAWSGMPAGTPFANQIKVVIPADSLNKFGKGTYTAWITLRRIFGTAGTTINATAKVDFQIGNNTVDLWPMSSQLAGQSCASCHGLNGPTRHYGAKGVEDCLPCHTDNMEVPFYKLLHAAHIEAPTYPANPGACSPCHINDSANKFTTEANYICSTCHSKVPGQSLSHLTAIPLYASSGMSCATLNCHSGGNLGSFKTPMETHEALLTKYAGGTVTAKKTDTPITIDGIPDVQWGMVDGITSVSGITVKFLYDDTYLYSYAKWVDGHREYPSGAVGSSKSEFRRQWNYDGTTWTRSTNDEDRLAFAWKMDDNLGASCGRTCHDAKPIHATNNTKMDVWHWRAQRSNPLGLMDDQYWDATGRKSDVVTSGSFGVDNITGTLPTMMGPDAASNLNPWLLQTTAIPFVNSGFIAGSKLPGYIINNATVPAVVGSRGDITAKAVYDNATGTWTLEIKRLLNTGNADDFVANVAIGNEFTIAKFDNVGSDHVRQGIDPGVYHLIYSPEIIPVELASFEAKAENNKVNITWKTATETNNKGFEIERKNNTDWETITFIGGKGSTTNISSYSYTDQVNVVGKYIYRLKQIDFDGTVNYSNEVEVLVQPSEFSLSQNYPNPFNPSTTIKFTLAAKGQVIIKVFSINGQEVATIINEEKDAGYYSVQYNASSLASGVYLYRMVAGKFNMTKKFILLK